MRILFSKPDDSGGIPDPTVKPQGGHRSPVMAQDKVKKNGGAPAK